MEKQDDLIGKTVEFHAERISRGNPVRGVITGINDEWIEVELSHDIDGIANSWFAGETRDFRKVLIRGGMNGIKTNPTG